MFYKSVCIERRGVQQKRHVIEVCDETMSWRRATETEKKHSTLFPITTSSSPIFTLLRCDDNISKLPLLLTTVGAQPPGSTAAPSTWIHENKEWSANTRESNTSENNGFYSRASDPTLEWDSKQSEFLGKKRVKKTHFLQCARGWKNKQMSAAGLEQSSKLWNSVIAVEAADAHTSLTQYRRWQLWWPHMRT